MDELLENEELHTLELNQFGCRHPQKSRSDDEQELTYGFDNEQDNDDDFLGEEFRCFCTVKVKRATN